MYWGSSIERATRGGSERPVIPAHACSLQALAPRFLHFAGSCPTRADLSARLRKMTTRQFPAPRVGIAFAKF
jgi:hypothetical protein